MDVGGSLVEYFSEHEHYRCGYCGSPDTNASHGMWAHSMTVQDYQDLIDRGWRRSGKYCYKPTMNVTCCPLYTIKLDSRNFKLSKSQKKVIKQVNRYLIDGVKRGEADNTDNSNKATPSTTTEKSSSNTAAAASKRNPPKPGVGADPNKPQCKKSKEVKNEKYKEKMAKSTSSASKTGDDTQPSTSKTSNEQKTLEDYLNEPEKAEKCTHKLEIRLLRSHPRSQEFKSSFKDEHSVYVKYQVGIHKDAPSKPNQRQYTRFLVDSPLKPITENTDLPMGYGSFHQQYVLDGNIIAVGVIDILPSCTSSVYLYYDPAYDFLSLGTYTALREIAFTRYLNSMASKLQYYYMGFYVHKCPKMKYKGSYFPSYLSCPETYKWIPIEKCKPLLDKNNYSRLSDSDQVDENGKIELSDLDKVLVVYEGEAMPYEIYRALKSNVRDAPEVQQYAQFVGKVCSQRMLLFRK